MMTSTASIQVNVDAGPQTGWAARVRLAHALGPTMIAIAANSPLLGGRFSGWLSTRQRVWVSSTRRAAGRCWPPAVTIRAPTGRATRSRPGDVGAQPRRGAGDALCAVRRVGRRPHDARRSAPTVADLDYHLTTLFPRCAPRLAGDPLPRQRPGDMWPAVVFTLVTLLDDPVAADAAAEAVAPVATAWDTAARIGLGDRRLYAAANRCVAIAAERAPAQLHEGMRRLIEAVEQGRCPADDFSDRVIGHGIAPTVARLAQGES
ncbi:glutamate-cysteine ligase 2 family protein [Mycobacterium xenopi 3993]|nr:glutamate-cysteine ligase 2 family protein [Mycobacterium xenopi 3993]